MKKFLIFMAAIAMFACTPNPNIEDPAKKHQPADPTTWSPVGKTYRSDYLTFYFFSKDSLTNADDYGVSYNVPYELNYPKLIYNNHSMIYTFKDTLTIVPDDPNRTYKYTLETTI